MNSEITAANRFESTGLVGGEAASSESALARYSALYSTLTPGESYVLDGIAAHFGINKEDATVLEKVMSMGVWTKRVEPSFGVFYEYGGLKKAN